jgi:hypothetical protein
MKDAVRELSITDSLLLPQPGPLVGVTKTEEIGIVTLIA